MCITQDDFDDWMKEAALMHKVYSHSFLNISAIAAINSEESFFRCYRDPSLVTETFIETALDGGARLGRESKTYRVLDMDF